MLSWVGAFHELSNRHPDTAKAAVLPTVVLSPLLLTETSPVTRPADPGEVMPETLKLHAARITVVLSEILEKRGYPHGGINE